MGTEKKYIIDNTNLTSLIVRDKMVDCFFDAHCLDAGIDLKESEENINREYCRSIIKKAFFDVNGDFDKPDKESLKKVVEKLKEFSINFRDQDLVNKHAKEISTLIDKL